MEAALLAWPPQVMKDDVPAWSFLPTGEFEVNGRDTESHVGELFWEDRAWETGPAIQARDWVFCLQRFLAPGADNKWLLCAYHGDRFYAFMEFTEPGPSIALRRSFLAMTVGCFWPLLHPETFDGAADPFAAAKKGDIRVNTVLSGPDALASLARYAKSGGRKKK